MAEHFRLSDDFCNKYEHISPKFGYNGLGEFVYQRTYSRGQEAWQDTVRRVVEGCFELQRRRKGTTESDQERAMAMFDCMFRMKFTPPGRGLWAMGTDLVEVKGMYEALFNCYFVSTNPEAAWCKKENQGPWSPYLFLVDMCFLGGGVGFDVLGANVPIHKPDPDLSHVFVVPDSREGWVESISRLLMSYMVPDSPTQYFDYSEVRPAGLPLKTFGGVSGGPEPLRQLHEALRIVLGGRCGFVLGVRTIVDIMNLLGKCVVAGNVRRASEIAFGSMTDEEFLDLKDYEKNPERIEFGWCSNNSVVIRNNEHVDFESIAVRTHKNGEPGYMWLDNGRYHGRMVDGIKMDDTKICGGNPCVTEDALVQTADGPRLVRDLIGVPFLASVYGKHIPCHQGFFATGKKPVYRLTTKEGFELKLTKDHKVLVKDAGFIEAGKLKAGDLIGLDDHSHTSFKSLEFIGKDDVYDCHVPEIHRFSANGIIVHNCMEILMESGEACNLAEVFLNRCKSFVEFLDAVKWATLYATAVATLDLRWPHSKEVLSRNRRIGVSVTGVAQFLAKNSLGTLMRWLDQGYMHVMKLNMQFAEELGINRAVRLTCVKPSGTISLLGGATPGVHFPESRFYIRRVRMLDNSPFPKVLKEAGYPVVPDERYPNTLIVEFPVDVGKNVETLETTSIERQFMMAALMQKWWADNAVSCTITFDPNKVGPERIAALLRKWGPELKGISLFPKACASYAQLPYESITKKEYKDRLARIKPCKYPRTKRSNSMVLPKSLMHCDGEKCSLI